MGIKPFAEATARNAESILGVLRRELADAKSVLEIGSGTGQHAVYFGSALSGLVWNTSELPENLPAIHAWLADAGLANVREPLAFDVRTAVPRTAGYDAVFSANTAHIMSLASVERMFAVAAHALREPGRFCLYGPFRQGGLFNADSNAAFHQSLRERDGEMGIRHLEDLDGFAGTCGLSRTRLYSMPANNNLVIWEKSLAREAGSPPKNIHNLSPISD